MSAAAAASVLLGVSPSGGFSQNIAYQAMPGLAESLSFTSFPAPPSRVYRGPTAVSVQIVRLTEWVLRNVPCKCRKRDGSRISYTLALDRLSLAANYDKRCSDLVAGEPNFGLRPERRIPADLLRRLGYSVGHGEGEWLPPPDGYRSWTSAAGDVLRSPAQSIDEPADGARMPGAKGPPSAGSVARSPD